ncbi:MAG TPA: GAP family protein [Agromyces mariniharenae]|nr:GAP family protein [Agromyces mariniharenae]
MLEATWHILPISIAVAISSVPIMATILILLSPNRTRSALPFLIGFVLGLALVVTLCTLFAQAIPTPRSARRPDTAVGTAEILVGLALVVIAVVAWVRARRNPSTAAPKWLEGVSRLGAWGSFGLALLLNVRPKALLLAIAAGLALRGDGVTATQAAILIGVYTLVSASTVAVPIIATLVDHRRMEPRLLRAREWLDRNSGQVTAVILLLIGLVIIGTGIARL